jgi:hypothetical protein
VHPSTKTAAILSHSDYPIFLETGTSFGETFFRVLEHKGGFKRALSIESDYDKYLVAVETLNVSHMVTRLEFGASIIYGDSADLLGRVLDISEAPTLIWLDAHGSHPDSETPISAELAHCFHAPRLRHHHIILIDDADLFGVYSKWPTLEEIEETAARAYYTMGVEDNIITLLPRIS